MERDPTEEEVYLALRASSRVMRDFSYTAACVAIGVGLIVGFIAYELGVKRGYALCAMEAIETASTPPLAGDEVVVEASWPGTLHVDTNEDEPATPHCITALICFTPYDRAPKMEAKHHADRD